MSNAVIHGEGLGKKYQRGALQQSTLLRDHLSRALKAPLSVFRRKKEETFWALKDVSLEVHEGEVLGLIGRNGAGKTTLLKILSRITRPTAGWAEIRGRVGSLLEVGTGFHPELTGRENTFLSGAILGMSRKEIEKKFDEIVAFAELEKFIDTPVKHYSSGMFVRLAFAVAAHLEPEILLVDEVLAVGDINFQKKCLGKMGDVARAGRTVVLVSHNMAAITSLCSRCVILEGGQIIFDGSAMEATARYYGDSLGELTNSSDLRHCKREGNGKALFTSVAIQARTSNNGDLPAAIPGCDISIEVGLECQSDLTGCNLAMIFYDSNGYRLIDTNIAQKGEFLSLRAGQSVCARFLLREVLLKPGKYFVGLWLGRHCIETVDHVEHAAIIQFIESEDTSRHSVIYPGAYLCRFETNIALT